MQFFKIAAYVQVANYMAWCIMRLVYFAIYMACGLRLLVWLVRMLMRSWLVWALSA